MQGIKGYQTDTAGYEIVRLKTKLIQLGNRTRRGYNTNRIAHDVGQIRVFYFSHNANTSKTYPAYDGKTKRDVTTFSPFRASNCSDGRLLTTTSRATLNSYITTRVCGESK